MLYGRYTFHCRLQTGALLPPYKGSTFRGAFGHALKRVVCALRHRDCGGCILKTQCLYACVFETVEHPGTQPGAGAAAVHPFVIEPPADRRTVFEAGSSFSFNLLLFGEVNRQLPYFVYAFDRMGMSGIGRRIDGRRGRFELESVHCRGMEIYSRSRQMLSQDFPLQDLTLAPGEAAMQPVCSMTVDWTTPLRLKFRNRLMKDLPFHLFVRALLRRASSLLATFGDGEPDLDYRGLVRRAESVETDQSSLRWHDWRRYSRRQNRGMLMGGLTGTVRYRGDLAEFMPLVEFCRHVHIGKQTTFGLGGFTVEAGP